MRPWGSMNAQDVYTGSHVPHDQWQVPKSVVLSRNSGTYPSGSPINPGYAYGTFIPLETIRLGTVRFEHPYTVPIVGSQVRMYQKTGPYATIDSRRVLKSKGLTTDLPGFDWNQVNATQQYLANQ